MGKTYFEKSKSYKGFHYSCLSEDMIHNLHAKIFEILISIINVFEKNNIRYMLCGGTLLGAMTTGKFIPWDDDIDICVFEDDYEKMKQLLIQELPVSIIVQCKETEPNYYHGWIKIRDKYSEVSPKEKIYQYNGVWIDIYNLKKIPENKVQREIHLEHLNYLIRRYMGGGISTKEMFRRIFENHLVQKTTKFSEEVPGNTLTFKYVVWSASKILLDPEWCFPQTTCIFEGIELPTFYDPPRNLIQHYGKDYEKLPPDENRCLSLNRIEII